MSDTTSYQSGAPLGVGTIISDSFSILFKHFFSVLFLGLVPTLISVLISGVLMGWGVALGTGEPDLSAGTAAVIWRTLLSVVLQVVISGITTALLVQLAYDAKLSRPIQLSRYVAPALGAAVPITILGFAAGILTGLGFMALIIPGLWVYAVFSMMPAAVVIEKVGMGGLGRSAALTKEYRWPIVGATILLAILSYVISFVAFFVVGLAIGAVGSGIVGIILGAVIFAFLTAIGVGIGSISIALIYARLREIKEGTSVRDIVAVFD